MQLLYVYRSILFQIESELCAPKSMQGLGYPSLLETGRPGFGLTPERVRLKSRHSSLRTNGNLIQRVLVWLGAAKSAKSKNRLKCQHTTTKAQQQD